MDPLGYSWVVFHPPKKLQRTGGSTGYCKDVSNTKYHCATNASVGVAKGAERIRSSTNHWVSRHPSTMVNCLFSSIVYKSPFFNSIIWKFSFQTSLSKSKHGIRCIYFHPRKTHLKSQFLQLIGPSGFFKGPGIYQGFLWPPTKQTTSDPRCKSKKIFRYLTMGDGWPVQTT